jgi:hypothetical protein
MDPVFKGILAGTARPTLLHYFSIYQRPFSAAFFINGSQQNEQVSAVFFPIEWV